MVIVVVSMGRDGGRNGGHAVRRTVSTGVGAVCHSELGARRSSVFSLYRLGGRIAHHCFRNSRWMMTLCGNRSASFRVMIFSGFGCCCSYWLYSHTYCPDDVIVLYPCTVPRYCNGGNEQNAIHLCNLCSNTHGSSKFACWICASKLQD